MPFPVYRPRRLRESPLLRSMVRETALRIDDFVYPLFAVHGRGVREPISSMPGQHHLSVDKAVDSAREAWDLGIPGVILFGIPEQKDAVGSEAWDERGVIQRAAREIKRAVPEMLVIADACFCEYTDHGHCGVLVDGELDNDASLDNLVRACVSYAKAGIDVVAPSGMLDGFVGTVREGLDEEGFDDTAILAYSAKYASGYYGPFREAVESAPQHGDRRGYQMDPANAREAIREVSMDVAEGADIVMVKPAGEKGWIDYDRVMLETLLGIRRAGADIILTYHAKEAAKLLR